MYTSHYTSRTLDIIHLRISKSYTRAALVVLCRHAALLGISPEVYSCVAALTTIVSTGAPVPTSNISVTILTSVSVLDHC